MNKSLHLLSPQDRLLQISQTMGQRLMDMFTTGMLLLDGERILWENQAARRLLQPDDGTLSGHSLFEFVSAPQHAAIRHLFARSTDVPHGTFYQDVMMQGAGETSLPVLLTISALTQEERLLHLLLIQDDTQRKEMVAAMQEHDQRFEQLLALVPDGIAVHKDGKVVYVNAEALRILQLDSDESLLGQTALGFVHPDDQPHIIKRIQQLMQTGQPVPFAEERFLRPDGSYVDLEVAAFPFTESGEPAVQVVFRDITERKQMLAAQERSERLFRTLTETTHAAIFIFDANDIHYTNPAASEITAYTADELKRLSFWKIVHPDHQEKTKNWIMQLLAGDTPVQSLRLKILTKEGQERWLEFTGNMMMIAQERLVLGTGFDITALLETQEQLQQNNRRLEVLRQIDAAGLTTNNLETIASVVFQRLPEIMPADRTSIFLLDTKTKTAQMIGEQGLSADPMVPQKVFTLQVPEVMYEQMAAGIPLFVEDVGLMVDISPLFQSLYSQDIRSFISAPLLVQGQQMGSLNIGSKHRHTFKAIHRQIACEIADRLAMALHNVLLYNELEASLALQKNLAHRMVQIQEKERQGIARDLHDELGSQLTALKLTLDRIHIDETSPMWADWQLAQDTVEGLIGQIRELLQGLRPTMLDELGLLPTLIWQINGFTHRTQIPVHFSHDGLDQRFDGEVEITAYRVVQEALTNVARHAQAHDVDVIVLAEPGTLELCIRDDGIGFDAAQFTSPQQTTGLANLRERIRMLGGQLKIDTQPGEGVEVVALIPLGSPQTSLET